MPYFRKVHKVKSCFISVTTQRISTKFGIQIKFSGVPENGSQYRVLMHNKTLVYMSL